VKFQVLVTYSSFNGRGIGGIDTPDDLKWAAARYEQLGESAFPCGEAFQTAARVPRSLADTRLNGAADDTLRVYVGWDSREPEAYVVCEYSLLRHASVRVECIPIKQEVVRDKGLYWRAPDPLASTEFTYTRFLVPHLAEYRGWAIFCDSDFLWTADVEELWRARDPRYAVMCVQHDYVPKETTKMDGAVQTAYPRKNWSSLMLFNCEHAACQKLTVEAANTQSGAYLHRMQWAADEEIGVLNGTWNWLEGWNEKPASGLPGAIHYTRGGPWFEQWQDVDYADVWRAEYEAASGAQP